MRHNAAIRMCFAISLLIIALFSYPHSQPTAAQTDPVTTCTELLANYSPVMGTNRYVTPADIPLPSVRQPWLDPTFGTCVIRITDRQNDFENPLVGLKNEYSRVQSFNADETLLITRDVEGDWYLYGAQTLHPIQRLATDIAIDEPRWDANNPYRFTFSPWGDTEKPLMMIADLTPTGEQFELHVTVAHDFTDELPADWNTAYVWRRWEGSPSADSRYDAFMAEDHDSVTRGLVTYDWQTDKVLGLYTVPHGEANEPDSVSMSSLGNYVLAQFEYCEPGTTGTFESPCGAMIYTRDLTSGWSISRIIGHSDLAVDAQGREVLLYQEIDTDQIVMTDLVTGAVTPLFDLDYANGSFGLHFSGQAANRPGWALVSVFPEEYPLDFSNPFWMVGTIFAVELKANPRVIQLAHHHSIRSEAEPDYFAEPHATVNRDFTRLLFTSNWEVYGTGEVETYMVILPEGWLDRLPE